MKDEQLLKSIWLFVIHFSITEARPPTAKEIRQACYVSKTTLQVYLTELDRQGKLEYVKKRLKPARVMWLPNDTLLAEAKRRFGGR